MTVSGVSPTPKSLLVRLRSPADRAAWVEFVELYSGLILLWVRRLGVDASEADDVTQEVFMKLAKKLPSFEYDPSQRFRGYLFSVTRGCAVDALRRKQPGNGTTVTLPVDLSANTDAADEIMEAEYRAHVTRQAFWFYVVENQPAEQVAHQVGISMASVYQAKTRVLRRLLEEHVTDKEKVLDQLLLFNLAQIRIPPYQICS